MIKFSRFDHNGIVDIENPCACRFGITEAIVAVVTAVSATISAGAVGLGIGAETAGIIGTLGTGALIGGGLGALTNLKNPLKGLEMGALTGVGVAAGGVLGPLAGIGATAGDVLGGAAGGLLGGLATGQNLGTSALEGATSGLTAGALSGAAAGTTAPTTGGAGSAAAGAAPASVGAPGADVTAPLSPPTLDTGFGTIPTPGAIATGQAPGLPLAGAPGGPGVPNAQIATQGAGDLSSLTPSFQSPLSGPTLSTPGSVDTGAASSVPSNVGGVKAPTDVGAAWSKVGDAFSNIGSSTPTGTDVAGGGAGPSAAGTDSSFSKFIKSPQGALTTLGFAGDILRGNQQPAGFKQLKSLAATDLTAGQQLTSLGAAGQLTPGLQAELDSALASGEATIRQQYANAGLSYSSPEAQSIADLKLRGFGQGAEIALKLMNEGVQESQIGADLYLQLMQITNEQDQAFGESLSGFTKQLALMGSPPTTTGTAATGTA